MPEEWIRSRIDEKPPLAQSYCGMRIEVAGNPWGVVVVDSRMEHLSRKRMEMLSTQLAFYLGKLLEGL